MISEYRVWSVGLQRMVRHNLAPPVYLTHHPAQPGLLLRAGEALRYGDVCWINEDGTVWRVDPQHPRPVVDGLVLENAPLGTPVSLVAGPYVLD